MPAPWLPTATPGAGARATRRTAQPAAEDTFRQISASGNLHSCGVLTDGTVNVLGIRRRRPVEPAVRPVQPGEHRRPAQLRRPRRRHAALLGRQRQGSGDPARRARSPPSAPVIRTRARWPPTGASPAGAPTTTGQATPPAGSFLIVSAGYGHTCGLQVDGTAVCWGCRRRGSDRRACRPTCSR